MLDDASVYAVGSVEDDGGYKPDGAGPVCPMFDIEAVIERWSGLDAESRRRTAHSGPRRARSRATASDPATPQRPQIDLILYVSPVSDKSQRALRAVREVLRDYEPKQVNFSTCDLSAQPQAGDVHSVVFTPTLVTQGGTGPRTAIIGNLEDKDVLRDLLDSKGVARRWDD